MWDLTLALEELRDDLAETQRKISILEQTGRELMAIVDRSGEPEIDPLIGAISLKSRGEWLWRLSGRVDRAVHGVIRTGANGAP